MASRFVDDCVRAMNVVRDRHQVSPLKHNPDITSTAQSWADHMASAGSLSHNSKASYRGENLGENCAMNWTSDRQDFTGTLSSCVCSAVYRHVRVSNDTNLFPPAFILYPILHWKKIGWRRTSLFE